MSFRGCTSSLRKLIFLASDSAWFGITERLVQDPRGIDILFKVLCEDKNVQPPPDFVAKVLQQLPDKGVDVNQNEIWRV